MDKPATSQDNIANEPSVRTTIDTDRLVAS